MSFVAEERLARLRPRVGKLFFPMLVLFLAAFTLSFFSGRLTEQWQTITLLSLSGAVVFLFWFIPMINYLSTFLEVTTTRVVYRKGLFGQQRREVSISSIQNVELTKGRSITITAEGQEPLVLTGIPKHKLVAVEIDRLAASI